MNIEIYRRRTAMVLHQIEMALGNFVIEHDDVDMSDVIYKLSQSRDMSICTTKDFVENSYLDDLFQVIIATAKGRSFESDIISLRSLFVQYGIFNIRNVIAHPNRTFLISYWYKVAALASDPLIDMLRLSDVNESLLSAEKGIITDPPQEWLLEIFHKLPNNLPVAFEHDITGLIGRNTLISTLRKSLMNKLDRRSLTISLVAPGGNGKTAIVLETLKKIIDDPNSQDAFDGCIYVTLKTEELTDEGVKELDAATSVDGLKTELLEIINNLFETSCLDFMQMVDEFENKNLLICIDNLETLLVNNSEEFDELLSFMPLTWKILITSRITIDNSKTVAITPLRSSEALQIASKYLVRKTGGAINEKHVVDAAKLAQIVHICNLNPLAIRLTIDLYLRGGHIENAAKTANTEIIDFSFRNLIDTLSLDSVKILECLYLKPDSTRSELRELLSLPEDNVRSSIQQLSNTSLINRETTDVETFKLGESIASLLLTNKKNIELRGEIQKIIGSRANKLKIKSIDQRQRGISENSIEYIDDNLPEQLKVLILEINSKINNRRHLTALAKQCELNELDFKGFPEFNIAYGRVLQAVKAYKLASEKFQIAIEQRDTSIVAQYLLGLSLFLQAKYHDASEVFVKISDVYEPEQIGDQLYSYLIDYMFRSLLLSSNSDVILERTINWKTSKYRSILGSARARAIKNIAEKIEDPDSRIKELKRSIAILEDVIREDGYGKSVAMQIQNISNEIAMLMFKMKFNTHSSASEMINFILKHTPELFGYVDFKNSEYLLNFIKESAAKTFPGNPFQKPFWKDFLYRTNSVVNVPDFTSCITDDHIEVDVEKVLIKDDRMRNFLFAKDEEGQQYFVHFNARGSEDITYALWEKLQRGSVLSILADKENKQQDKQPVATEYFILEI